MSVDINIIFSNLLTEKQSGYRPGHSTQIQLLYLSHQLYSALNENKDFTAIFLDISKYFDKIWHEGLIAKCELQYNISGNLLAWLKSYLKDRSQVFRVGTSFSSSQISELDALRARCLDLCSPSCTSTTYHTKQKTKHFSTQTTRPYIHLTHQTSNKQHRQSLQGDMDLIRQYGTDWVITFNIDKTVRQTFTNRPNSEDLRLNFDGQLVPSVTNHKHLGLNLSNDLHFHQHINSIIRTVHTFLGPIYPIAKLLPRSTLNEIYMTYIRPHFDYCDIIYDGNITSTDSIRLQILQNRCARLVTGTLFRTPTDALLKDLGWERLETRRLIHKLLFFHRLYYNYPPLPSYLTNLLSLTDTRHDATGLRLRNVQLLSLPPIRLTSFRRSYFPATIRQWNLLPESLRNTLSPREFSRQVWQRFGAPEPPALNSIGTKTLNIQHTRLRVGLATLNAHLFQFQLTPSPACSCGHKHENTVHYMLWFPQYTNQRLIFLNDIRSIFPNFDSLSAKQKLDTLLYGSSLSEAQGIFVAQHLHIYIAQTHRFDSQH